MYRGDVVPIHVFVCDIVYLVLLIGPAPSPSLHLYPLESFLYCSAFFLVITLAAIATVCHLYCAPRKKGGAEIEPAFLSLDKSMHLTKQVAHVSVWTEAYHCLSLEISFRPIMFLGAGSRLEITHISGCVPTQMLHPIS